MIICYNPATCGLIEYSLPSTTPILPPPPPGPPFPIPSSVIAMMHTKQSGQVTPGHLAAWATDEVLVDAGVQFNNTFGKYVSTVLVNFNASNTDFPIPINLPVGFQRYRVEQVIINAASGNISSATCGVFTSPGGAGIAIVAGNTAVTVSQAANDTVGNMQSLSIAITTTALVDSPINFRVQTPQGSAATAQVSVFYQPLP